MINNSAIKFIARLVYNMIYTTVGTTVSHGSPVSSVVRASDF